MARNPFKVGDLALHKSNDLDARPVEAVEGSKIRLRIGTLVTPPVPASNYVRIPARAERGSAMRASLLFSVVVASAVLLGTALRPTEAAPAPMSSFRACAQEDSRSCVWDARHQGNGAGTSFISGPKGQTIYVTHRVAHTLICGSLGATPKPRWC